MFDRNCEVATERKPIARIKLLQPDNLQTEKKYKEEKI